MTTVDRTSEPNAVFAEHLARIEAAPFAEEGAVERVIDALYSVKWPDGDPKLHMARTHVRALAVAALAAMCPAPGHDPHAATRRVEALAEEFEAEAEVREVRAQCYPPTGAWALDHNRLVVRADTFRRSAARIRAALRPADVAGDGEQR